MTKITDAFSKLDWNIPEKEQSKARHFISSEIGRDLSMLILNPAGKRFWKNSALVLAEIGQPKIDPYLIEISSWLQDWNWPGAEEIFQLLVTVKHPDLDKILADALTNAMYEQDELWITTIESLQKSRALEM